MDYISYRIYEKDYKGIAPLLYDRYDDELELVKIGFRSNMPKVFMDEVYSKSQSIAKLIYEDYGYALIRGIRKEGML